MALTSRQQEVLRHVRAGLALGGRAPTPTEIATKLGVSRQAVSGVVRRLIRKGVLSHKPGTTGTLATTRAGAAAQVVSPRPPAPQLYAWEGPALLLVDGGALVPVRVSAGVVTPWPGDRFLEKSNRSPLTDLKS